jgi:hypothetical protein
MLLVFTVCAILLAACFAHQQLAQPQAIVIPPPEPESHGTCCISDDCTPGTCTPDPFRQTKDI